MEEWYLKDMMSKLTIKFLIAYDLDNIYIFSDFDYQKVLYYIIQDDLQETEDDQNDSNRYPFDLDRVGYKKIVMAIPYLLIEKVNVCPCCVTFDRQLFF